MTMDQVKQASSPAEGTHFTSDQTRVLSLLLNDTKTLVALKDLDHRCLFANHKLESLHAVQPGGLLGTPSDIFVAPATVAKIHAIENDIIRTGRPAHFVERVNINGQTHAWETIRFPFRDQFGNIAGTGFVAFESDEQREADAAEHGTPAQTASKAPGILNLMWSKKYECGNPTIDHQHHTILEHSNQLLSAMLKGQPQAHIWQLLKSLRELLLQHFHDEESIMRKATFPDANEHHQTHDKLIAKSDELAIQVKQNQLKLGDLFHFLAHDVIAQHLLTEDRKFSPYLNPDFPIVPNEPQEPSGFSDVPVAQVHGD